MGPTDTRGSQDTRRIVRGGYSFVTFNYSFVTLTLTLLVRIWSSLGAGQGGGQLWKNRR